MSLTDSVLLDYTLVQTRLTDSPRWECRWRVSNRRHTLSPERSSLQSASQSLDARSGNPINKLGPAKHTGRWLLQLSSLLDRRSVTQHDNKLTAVTLKVRVRPTSVELWSVVVRRVPPFTEECRQVPPHCDWQNQGHTNPEWTYAHAHIDVYLMGMGCFFYLSHIMTPSIYHNVFIIRKKNTVAFPWQDFTDFHWSTMRSVLLDDVTGNKTFTAASPCPVSPVKCVPCSRLLSCVNSTVHQGQT